jgi:hypothetical protein
MKIHLNLEIMSVIKRIQELSRVASQKTESGKVSPECQALGAVEKLVRQRRIYLW